MQHDHAMMSATEATGDLIGHLAPGLGLLLWAIVWLMDEHRRRHDRHGAQTPSALEPWRWVGMCKLLVAPIAIFAHLPTPDTWSDGSIAMAWQHAFMFAPIGLTGVVDLAARARRLPPRATFAACALARALAALLLLGHGNPPGVEKTAHQLLAIAFLTAAFGAALEALGAPPASRWLRMGGVLTAAIWMLVISWVLFLSGWDLADHVNVMWTVTLFSGSVTGSGILLALTALRTPAAASS
jgi:hypothetical protein